MAIIVPDVAPQPIPNVRVQANASTETFGGGPGLDQEIGEAQKIAQETGDVASFEKIRADQTAIEGARAAATQASLKTVYDPDTGILSSKGLNSLQAQKDGLENLQKNFADIYDGLNGQAQKGAFSKIGLDLIDQAQRTTSAHVDKQMGDYHQQAMESTVNGSAALAALGHGDQTTLATSFKNSTDATESYIASNHLDDQAATILRQQNADKVHTAIIDGMTKFQNDDSAQKYFDQYKAGGKIGDQTIPPISPEAQVKITQGLEEHNLRWRSSSAAQDIMNSHPDSETDALKATDKINNPEIQDSARKLISARFAEDRQATKNDQDATFMQMQQMVNQKGLTDPVDRRMAVPPMAWNKLSSEQQRAIEKGGEMDVTSPKMLIKYHEAIKDGSLAQMSEADIQTKFLQYADSTDQHAILKAWDQSQKGTNHLSATKTFNQMVDQGAVDAKIVSSPNSRDWSDDERSNWKAFGDKVQEQVDATETATGKKMSPADQRKLIQQITIDHTFTHKGFFSDDHVFVPFDDIPEQYILNARKEYPTATEDQVARSFAVLKNGGKPQDARAVFNEKQ